MYDKIIKLIESESKRVINFRFNTSVSSESNKLLKNGFILGVDFFKDELIKKIVDLDTCLKETKEYDRLKNGGAIR